MKQLVILSGKGGTGKTSLAAAFAHIAFEGLVSCRAVLADADVDAANLELALEPELESRREFWGGKIPEVDRSLCIGCGLCEQVCRFEAISAADGEYWVDPIACEGCAACAYACPEGAIKMVDQLAGEAFYSRTRYGPLFHAELRPAEENSGKLVTLVKQMGRLHAMENGYDLLIVDGPPGIGCPVISAVSGADLALIVAEPTAAGIHDMGRVLETVKHFNVPAMVCINKADLYPAGTAQIESYCAEQDIPTVGRIPYDHVVTAAMVQGIPVTAYRPKGLVSERLSAIWNRVLRCIRDEDAER